MPSLGDMGSSYRPPNDTGRNGPGDGGHGRPSYQEKQASHNPTRDALAAREHGYYSDGDPSRSRDLPRSGARPDRSARIPGERNDARAQVVQQERSQSLDAIRAENRPDEMRRGIRDEHPKSDHGLDSPSSNDVKLSDIVFNRISYKPEELERFVDDYYKENGNKEKELI